MVLGTFWALGMDHVPAPEEPTALRFTSCGSSSVVNPDTAPAV